MTIQSRPETPEILSSMELEAAIYRVPFEGGHVTWRRFGAGEPLVLLHGGHGRWTHWARNIRAWSSQFTLWIPDLPGYGDSDLPGQATLESLVYTTLQTLDALVPRNTALRVAAFSFGSLVAVPLAVKRGAVSRLVLLGPAGHGGVRRPRGELRSWRGLSADSEAWRDAMRHNLLMHMIHHDASGDALALHIHGDACVQARFRSKPLSRAGCLPGLLAAYKGSLLLMWGEHDVTAEPAHVAASLAAVRADCQVELVADAGHWVQYEAAPEVNGRVLSWLSEAVNAS